jgi:hypothetical protein
MNQHTGQYLPIYHTDCIEKVALQRGLSPGYMSGFQKSGLFLIYRHVFTDNLGS